MQISDTATRKAVMFVAISDDDIGVVELLDGMTLYELLEHWMYEELRGGVNTVGIMKRKTMRK